MISFEVMKRAFGSKMDGMGSDGCGYPDLVEGFVEGCGWACGGGERVEDGRDAETG